MKPTIVVVGAQKARTSSLAEALARTPGLYFHPREVAVFEHPYAPDADAGAFAGHLRARPEPVVGFKRADLLGRPEAPALLAGALGDEVVVLASLRHPVDRAISATFWYVRQGLLPPWEVNRLLTALLDRGWLEGFPRSGEILSYGRYAAHLARYEERFGAARVVVARDDGWEAPLADLGRRLGLGPIEVSAAIHAKKGQYSVRRAAFTDVPRASGSAVPDWAGRYADGSLVAALDRRARDLVDRVVLSRLVPDDRIDDEVRRRIEDRYAGDLDALRARWGIEL